MKTRKRKRRSTRRRRSRRRRKRRKEKSAKEKRTNKKLTDDDDDEDETSSSGFKDDDESESMVTKAGGIKLRTYACGNGRANLSAMHPRVIRKYMYLQEVYTAEHLETLKVKELKCCKMVCAAVTVKKIVLIVRVLSFWQMKPATVRINAEVEGSLKDFVVESGDEEENDEEKQEDRSSEDACGRYRAKGRRQGNNLDDISEDDCISPPSSVQQARDTDLLSF